MSSSQGKTPSRHLKVLLLGMIAILAILHPLPAWCQEARQKHLLVLHSYDTAYKWTNDIDRGIASALEAGAQGTRIDHEYMGTKRVSDPVYFGLLHETYRYKYRASRFDVIIAADNDAFNFLRAYRDDLFPDTPVVFCGVNYLEISQLHGFRLFTGVNETADIRATLDLALKLQPHVRRVAVVNDTTTTGRIVHNQVVDLAPGYQGIEFVFLEDLDVPELLSAVQKLGSESLVLYSFFFRDKEGRPFSYDEVISLLARTCPVPIYGMWDFNLGYGIVGGMLASGYYQGETAGAMAVRILRGEPVEKIPVVMRSPNRYMFDYRQLQRFGLSTASLPAESVVINKPAPFYAVSAHVFYAALAVAGALTVVVLLLLRMMKVRRQTEQELRDAAVKYRIVADNTYDWEFWLDPEGRFAYTSLSCESLTGHNAEEFISDPDLLRRIIHPDDQPKFARHWCDVFEHRCLGKLQMRIILPDGSVRWIEHVCRPVFDDNGLFLGRRGSNRDITERMGIEQMKDEMISAVSHEMRTPLTAMLGFSQFLLENRVDEAQLREYIGIIHGETERLNALIGNFLDLQRFRARETVCEYIQVEVQPLLEKAADLSAKAAPQHRFTVHPAGDVPPVLGDETLLLQVLGNLLTNASKYSPNGSEIALDAQWDGKSVTLSVRDQGEGIAPELHEKIFETFYRVDSTDRRLTGGTGLGLPLVREIVHAHRGRIWVESMPGEGSTFYVSLPAIKEGPKE